MSAEQGSLFRLEELARRGTWKMPEALPILQGKYTSIAMDVEATGKDKQKDKAVGAAIFTPDRKKMYLPWGHLGGGNFDETVVKRWAKEQLKGLLIVNLNTGYDAEMTRNAGLDLEGQGCTLRDVAHSAALLNENRYGGFNLNDLGIEYVGRKKMECPVPPADIHRAHSSLIGDYAENDAELAWDIHEKQLPQLHQEDLMRVQELKDDLIWVNNHMERNGARLDRPKLERWCREAKKQFGDTILEIHRLTGMKINPNSSGDLTKLFKHLDIKNPNHTGSGAESFTDEFIKTIDHPVVVMAREARQVDSLRSKYLEKYLKHLGAGDILKFHLYQLRAGKRIFGTVSGRYSSASVNIQQVFKAEKQEERLGGAYIIRELFIPDEGMELFSGDASQIEFRLFGHYSRSKKIIQAYRQNPKQDFHQLVADLFHQPRYQAKNNNFGKIYGMGRYKTAIKLGLPCSCNCPAQDFWDNERHAQGCLAIKANEIIDQYDQEFPEAKRLMRQAMSLAESRGYVLTLLGRRARFPDKQRMHSALNRVIQGSAADLFKLKLRRLYRERFNLGIHKLRMPIHDEEVGDNHPDPTVRARMIECFQEQEMELSVPILWDVAFGMNWKEVA